MEGMWRVVTLSSRKKMKLDFREYLKWVDLHGKQAEMFSLFNKIGVQGLNHREKWLVRKNSLWIVCETNYKAFALSLISSIMAYIYIKNPSFNYPTLLSDTIIFLKACNFPPTMKNKHISVPKCFILQFEVGWEVKWHSSDICAW